VFSNKTTGAMRTIGKKNFAATRFITSLTDGRCLKELEHMNIAMIEEEYCMTLETYVQNNRFSGSGVAGM
jgi:hypothetical protein